MAGVVQQLPALLVVVVGVLASYVVGAATERARWRREQAAWRADQRVQAYANYGYAIKDVYVQCRRAFALRSQPADGDRAAYRDALDELGKLTHERTAKWEPVLLLGSPETVAAGHAWHRRVYQVELFARGERTDTGQWDHVLDDVIACRSRFYAAARKDLGIEGELPAGVPWEAEAVPVPAPAAAA